jgi:ribonuclease Z
MAARTLSTLLSECLRAGKAPIPLKIVPLAEGQVTDAGEFTVDCFPVHHSDTDSFGFSFESQACRYLRPERLSALGVPDGPVGKALTNGKPVMLEEARQSIPMTF